MARNRGNTPSIRWGYSRAEAGSAGFRSTYEYAIAKQLEAEGVAFEYEAESYPIYVPASRVYICKDCGGDCLRQMVYTPDFFFNERTFIVEAKGRFDAAHRVKALEFRKQYPSVEYALLFEENNKLSKKSKTRYTDWAEKNGILCAVGLMPRNWLKEVT